MRRSKEHALSTPFYEEPLPSSLPVAGPSIINKGKGPERHLTLEDDDDEYHDAMEEQPISKSSVSLAADIASPAESSSLPMSEVVGRVDHTRIPDASLTRSQERTTHASNEGLPDNSARLSTPRSPALQLQLGAPRYITSIIFQDHESHPEKIDYDLG